MMKPLVYIETTIPSYYCDGRSELARDIARTREWWDEERENYECFISPVVLEELEDGDYPYKEPCLELLQGLSLLEINEEIEGIADVYQIQKLMPGPPSRDAVHVAVASYYRMDFLLTWNCRHLANANKVVHLETINSRLHVGLPMLTTPEQLRLLEEGS